MRFSYNPEGLLYNSLVLKKKKNPHDTCDGAVNALIEALFELF